MLYHTTETAALGVNLGWIKEVKYRFSGVARGGGRGPAAVPNPGTASVQECRWGLPHPDTLNGVWGGAQRGGAPNNILTAKGRPGAEPQMIQSGQPVWSRREEPNLSESSLAGGLA